MFAHGFTRAGTLLRTAFSTIAVIGALSAAPARADEAVIRDLYRDANKFAQTLLAKAEVIEKLPGDKSENNMPFYLRQLREAATALKADAGNIARIEYWKNVLSRKAADNIAKAGYNFAQYRTYYARTRATAARLQSREACNRLLTRVAPIEAQANPIKDSGKSENEKNLAYAKFAPQMDIHFNAYLADIEAVHAAYNLEGRKLAADRADLAPPMWRFVHFFEDLGNDEEAKIVRDALVYSAARRGRFDGVNYFALADTYLLTTQQCNIWVGLGLGILQKKIPGRRAELDDTMIKTIEAYDERARYVPPVPSRGGRQLERLARSLAGRKIQRFRLESLIEDKTTELDEAIEQLKRTDGMLADAVTLQEDLDRLTLALGPAGGTQTRLDEAKAAVTAAENALADAQRAVSQAQRNYDEAKRQSANGRIVNVGAGRYRKAKSNREGKPLSEVIALIDGKKKPIENAVAAYRQEIEEIEDLPASALTTPVLERYEGARKKLKEALRILAGYDAEILRARSIASAALPDRSVLDAAQAASVEARFALSDAREVLSKVEERARALASSGDSGRSAFRDAGRRYAIALTSWKGEKGAVAEAATTLPVSLGVLSNSAGALAAVRQARAGMPSVEGALIDASAVKRGKLAGLLAELRILDDKRAQTVGYIINLKLSASRALEIELPGAGASKEGEVIKGLREFSAALGTIKGQLKDADALLGYPAQAEGRLKQLNAVIDTNLTLPLSEARKRIENMRGFVKSSIEAASILEAKTGQAITVAGIFDKLSSRNEPTMAGAFAYVRNVIDVAKLGLGKAPVIGAVVGAYGDYLSNSVASIATKAQKIRQGELNQLLKLVYRQPERHLYTEAEIIKASPRDRAFGRFKFGERRDLLTILQARRLISLMSAGNIIQACDQPMDKSRKTNCFDQGPL